MVGRYHAGREDCFQKLRRVFNARSDGNRANFGNAIPVGRPPFFICNGIHGFPALVGSAFLFCGYSTRWDCRYHAGSSSPQPLITERRVAETQNFDGLRRKGANHKHNAALGVCVYIELGTIRSVLVT